MSENNSDLKLFYSIKEVAEMFDVKESTLRFWEKGFPQLKPFKAGRGVRKYSQKDIEILKVIHHLIKEQGHTLSGAKRSLAVNKDGTDKRVEVLQRLKTVRNELQAMAEALNSFTYEQMDRLSEPPSTLVGSSNQPPQR